MVTFLPSRNCNLGGVQGLPFRRGVEYGFAVASIRPGGDNAAAPIRS